jgi:hypothetical protein
MKYLFVSNHGPHEGACRGHVACGPDVAQVERRKTFNDKANYTLSFDFRSLPKWFVRTEHQNANVIIRDVCAYKKKTLKDIFTAF